MLSAAAGIFEDFKYHRKFLNNENAALEFSAHIGDIELKAIHLIRFNAAGEFVEIEKLVRPMEGAKALGNAFVNRATNKGAACSRVTAAAICKEELLMSTLSPGLRHLSFPGESMEYRAARNALLVEEMELRRQIERVANQRRALPTGGAIPEDYQFDGNGGAVKLSALFARGKDTLAIYSFMYGSDRERPCPGCTHFLDGLDGEAEHIMQRINLAVVAKSPLPRILDFAKERGWRRLHLLSTVGSTYDRDYFGDSTGLSAAVREQQDFKVGQEWDMPMLNVFRRDGGEIRHFWGSEVLYVPPEPGQEYRHNDALDPLWNVLDLTPEGRGNFHPKLSYA